ncbi:MAG: tetratricopeptide repeat protein [Terriglobales bacterium]
MLLLLSSLTPGAQVSKQSSNLELLQDAAQALTAGKLSRAESDLQSILRATPEDYRALDLLGVVRILQRREKDAEQLFRRAIVKNPDFAPAHAHLGMLCVQKGRPEEAVPQLREALRIDPARSDASAALVRILQDQARTAAVAGNNPKALALLKDASKYAPDNPDVQFELGTIELQISSWQDAVEAFQQTLKLRENDALARYDLGRAFMGLSNFEEARKQFATYVKIRPDDGNGYCALGMTLAALERAPEAREQFERSITLAPAQTESYFRLGLIDVDEKNLGEAARNLRLVLAREPKHAGALSLLGRVAFEQKHYSDAIDLLQQAIAVDDSLRETHYYLGLTFARVGRKEEADDQLQIATRLGHDEAEQQRTVFRIQESASDTKSSQPQN